MPGRASTTPDLGKGYELVHQRIVEHRAHGNGQAETKQNNSYSVF